MFGQYRLRFLHDGTVYRNDQQVITSLFLRRALSFFEPKDTSGRIPSCSSIISNSAHRYPSRNRIGSVLYEGRVTSCSIQYEIGMPFAMESNKYVILATYAVIALFGGIIFELRTLPCV